MTLSTSAVAVCCSSDSLQLVEQPRVFDRDDSLVGEVLHQLDLLVAERPHVLALKERSDRAPLRQKRDAEHRREAAKSCAASLDHFVVRISQNIVNVNGFVASMIVRPTTAVPCRNWMARL